MRDKLTILFSPESAYGPTNQCIGLGDVLRRRGHRVVFAAEASWAGRLEPFGFEEHLVELAAPADPGAGPVAAGDAEQSAGAFWADFIRDTAPEFRKPTVDQLATVVLPTWQALVDGAMYCETRLREILDTVRPDVVVEDNVVCFPALVTAEAPFVRIVSCNPLEKSGPGLPPAFSGLPQADRRQWASFRARYDTTHRPLWSTFSEWVVAQGAPPLPDLAFIHESKHANVYVYPQEADYARESSLPPSWHRIDSSVRETDEAYPLPSDMSQRPEGSALAYLSLGSLGGADVDLMRRLIEVLGRTRHRYVVSTGPRGDEIELAANMVGASMLPQTSVISQVDLVITHGGNNTTTEALHFGKPMIVLPLFWDQYDNAQRVQELGFGARLDTYRFADAELIGAVDRIAADAGLRARMAAVGERIRARGGLRAGATIIERVGTERRAWTQ